ncbi:unnamed protein product [Rhodiola kirilowii]
MTKREIKYFLVDAYTETAFKGNPAAVCFLEEEKDDEWLQAVAKEFNISQTCYLIPIVPDGGGSALPRFRLRWFTPVTEVKLCGHATLAAAHTLFLSNLVDSSTIEFDTLSGVLTAKRVTGTSNGDQSFSIELNFPSTTIVQCDSSDTELISKALNVADFVEVKTTLPENDLLVVLPTGKDVADLQPNIDEIGNIPGRGVIVTGAAPVESGYDFISRFFCPRFGIPEDPVCGTAHCALTTYWSEKLGKTDFVAYQASPRGGILGLRLDKPNHRVYLTGKAIIVMAGCILV